jgi:hypothetical protein
MITIRMPKGRLLEALAQNLKAHELEHEQAYMGYRRTLAKLIAELAKNVEDDDRPLNNRVYKLVGHPEPKSHADDYRRAINMLEAHDGDTIDLDNDSYRCYVEDEWDWQGNFKSTNSNYR